MKGPSCCRTIRRIVKMDFAGKATNITVEGVIEHNLEVISQADWIIDSGPDGGSKGGQVVFEGIPEQIIHAEQSITGRYLK
jgi:excinuclease UvrABC ATPase subunit